MHKDLAAWWRRVTRSPGRGGGMERRPGTPRLLRELNDRAALELLLTGGPMTRAQVGEQTGLSKVTASQLLARLEGRGLVEAVGGQGGGAGPDRRRPDDEGTGGRADGDARGPRLAIAAPARGARPGRGRGGAGGRPRPERRAVCGRADHCPPGRGAGPVM